MPVTQSNISTFTLSENQHSVVLNDTQFSKSSRCQRIFKNPIALIVNLCVVNICQMMVASIFYGSLNTLEKRFSYNSKISAIIMMSDLFLSTILSPLAGFYATRYNRSRMIACSSIVLGFSSLLTSFPYFVYGSNHFLSSNNSSINFELCTSSTHCNEAEKTAGATVWPAVLILLIANFLRGTGFAIYYVVALPFIDDAVSPQSSPLFISLMHGVSLVGRLSGYFLIAYFLSLYETPWDNPFGIKQSDPMFIGAWWLAFFVTGILVILTSLPLFFFPSKFKTLNTNSKSIQQNEKFQSSFLDSFRRFLANPLLILFFFGNLFRFVGINGFYAYYAKYVESQYRTTSSQASAIAGSTGFAPVSIGLIIGGIYISYFKPKAKFLFIIIFICELVSVGTIGSGLFLGCNSIKLDGVKTPNGFSLQSSCNQNCDCSTQTFSPVCGSDGQTTYFTPCHAGCKAYNETTLLFSDCSCFSNIGTSGYCSVDTVCDNLSIWLTLMTIGTLISSSVRTGNSLIAFRSCDPSDKTFTNGVLSCLLSLFAFLPCELFYGYIVDFSCLIWENKCGKQGNCWLYDQDNFRQIFISVSTFFMAVGSLFDFIIIFYSDRMKNLYGEDDEQNENK